MPDTLTSRCSSASKTPGFQEDVVLTVYEKATSETVWKIAGRFLGPDFGDTTVVIKLVDPEKMRMSIQMVPPSNAGTLPKQSI
jgi:hypothetical protein